MKPTRVIVTYGNRESREVFSNPHDIINQVRISLERPDFVKLRIQVLEYGNDAKK